MTYAQSSLRRKQRRQREMFANANQIYIIFMQQHTLCVVEIQSQPGACICEYKFAHIKAEKFASRLTYPMAVALDRRREYMQDHCHLCHLIIARYMMHIANTYSNTYTNTHMCVCVRDRSQANHFINDHTHIPFKRLQQAMVSAGIAQHYTRSTQNIHSHHDNHRFAMANIFIHNTAYTN